MRRYKFFFYPLLFALFIQTVKANEGETRIDVCLELFQPLNRSEIQKIFSEEGNYIKYKGQEGYLLFVEKTPNTDNMNYIFNMVSKALKEDLEKLGWQQYQGSVEEFRAERTRILDEKGELKEKYFGPEGYALYAKNYYKKKMQPTFLNVSAVLSETEFNKLGWQQYQGSVKGFRAERTRILDEKGELKEKYFGPEGYALYAKNYYNEKMQKAFRNVSAVLSETEFNKLDWQTYQGLVEEFRKERTKILDEKGELKEKYIAPEGYALYAEDRYAEDMNKAFQNVSAVLSKTEFKKLGWQAYQGSVEEFRAERARILDEKGVLKEKYIGPEGYALYAKDYYTGDMNKAFKNVSAVLSKMEFNKLGWQQYMGSVKEFRAERVRILDEKGELKEKYIGPEGYALYAKNYYNEKMQKAFKNVSAVLSETEFNKLDWQTYQGLVEEFRKERTKILDEKGELKEKYIGPEGYALYTKDYYNEKMQLAFQNVSTVLGGAANMKELGLGWKVFKGSADEFHKLVQMFEETNITELRGREGQEKVAKEIFKGDVKKTYKNVSALRELLLGDWETFKTLKWSL